MYVDSLFLPVSAFLNSCCKISSGKILEDSDLPVWVVTFSTQEMLVFRNALSREVVIGADNKVEQCNYAAVLTRVETELDNDITGGWKVVEVSVETACTRTKLELTRCRWLDGRLHSFFSYVPKRFTFSASHTTIDLYQFTPLLCIYYLQCNNSQ